MHIEEKSIQFGKMWHGLHKTKLNNINKFKYYVVEGIEDNSQVIKLLQSQKKLWMICTYKKNQFSLEKNDIDYTNNIGLKLINIFTIQQVHQDNNNHYKIVVASTYIINKCTYIRNQLWCGLCKTTCMGSI
jgi:hypothetical protein